MTAFWWITFSGLAMSVLALVGSVTLLLPSRLFDRLVMPLVALAAGSLLGGALFHMMPASVTVLGNPLGVYGLVALGFIIFLVLEQFFHWHHCHRDHAGIDRHPVGYLVLAADGLHNFLGGMGVAGAFIVDIRLGVTAWLVAAAHEVPQELGDFGLLVHSGWRRGAALGLNILSALTFLVGGYVAYALSNSLNVAVLIPFAAGNFLYIAAADLIPQFSGEESAPGKVVLTASFLAGLGILYVLAVFTQP
jgi:zinc and cadmium transporter